MDVLSRPSPNHGPRRGDATVELVVIHYTAMNSAEAALERLCDPASEVSAHYLIGEDGTLYQMVDETARAWHAGVGSWAGRGDVNSRSIGIELDNNGHCPFSEPLMECLEALLGDILVRHGLHPSAVIGHSDMAPDRKCDPGRHFDWERLARAGLAVWPEPAAPGDFLQDAEAFGYPVACGPDLVLEAFRQRFRPMAEGPLDDDDRAIMAGLARGNAS